MELNRAHAIGSWRRTAPIPRSWEPDASTSEPGTGLSVPFMACIAWGHHRLPGKVNLFLLRNSIATANCAPLALSLAPLHTQHRQRYLSRPSADFLEPLQAPST